MPTLIATQTDLSSYTMQAFPASGLEFDNGSGRVFLIVSNASGGSVTLTVKEQRTCSFGHPATDQTITVADSVTKQIHGPFDLMRFNDSKKRVTVTISAASDVTVAAVEG